MKKHTTPRIKDTITILLGCLAIAVILAITGWVYGLREAVRANKWKSAAYEAQAGWEYANNALELIADDKDREWDLFIEALIEVESSGRNKVVGDGGKALGCLQIHKCTVDDCNEFVGWPRFSLDDRADRAKSIEMFEVTMDRYNPGRDMHYALKIWNNNAPREYHAEVMKILNRKKNEQGN